MVQVRVDSRSFRHINQGIVSRVNGAVSYINYVVMTNGAVSNTNDNDNIMRNRKVVLEYSFWVVLFHIHKKGLRQTMEIIHLAHS
jgi:hypothetical protein